MKRRRSSPGEIRRFKQRAPLRKEPQPGPSNLSHEEEEEREYVEESNFMDDRPWFAECLVESMDSVQDIRNLGLAYPAYQDDIARILAREKNWNRGVIKNELTSKCKSTFTCLWI